MSDLSDEELERYARHIVLPEIGGVGQRRLKAASVLIVGAGGVASAAIPALAGAGVGRLTIVDDDTADHTNLQRQWLFQDSEIGKPKALLAAAFARRLNPHVEARGIETRIDAANAHQSLAGHDLVIDGSDNFATRLVAAAAQFQGQVGLFRGWEPDQACYRCFVGDAFDNDDCDNCAERGVLGAVTGAVGSFAALLAIRHFVGISDQLAGKLFLFDALSLSLRAIRIPKERNCKTCGGNRAQSA